MQQGYQRLDAGGWPNERGHLREQQSFAGG